MHFNPVIASLMNIPRKKLCLDNGFMKRMVSSDVIQKPLGIKDKLVGLHINGSVALPGLVISRKVGAEVRKVLFKYSAN